MLDAIVSGASVFEPQEVATLRAAYAEATRRVADCDGAHAALASIVHNIGRTRLRLRKSMDRPSDVRALAEEAVELYDYWRGQPDRIAPVDGAPAVADRQVKVFPSSYAAPVRTYFRQAAR